MLGAKCRTTNRGKPVGTRPTAGSGGPTSFNGRENFRAPATGAVTNRTKSGSKPGQATRIV